VMHQQWKLEEHLPLLEFTYSNVYQEFLSMSQFEALYGQSCNTPFNWIDPINGLLIRLDMLLEME